MDSGPLWLSTHCSILSALSPCTNNQFINSDYKQSRANDTLQERSEQRLQSAAVLSASLVKVEAKGNGR